MPPVDKSTRDYRRLRIGAPPRQPGDPPVTARELLERGKRVAVRCGVCREQDWQRGGPGRAAFIGYLADDHYQPGGVLLMVRHRHGFLHRPYQAAMFDTEASPTDPRPLDWRPRSAHEGFRVKCRYGHDLWVSAERFNQLIDRTLGADNTLYLPGH